MPKTLLVADDSVVIQKLVGLSFANEEVDLITTDNGDDAVRLTREQKPNLILADVVMPGKSGYEVCQEIKQDPELGHIPVLLLTGTFEAFDEARAREVSADGHITKPFEAQVLVERVSELLNRQPENGSAQPAETPPPAPGDDYDFFEEDRRSSTGEDRRIPAAAVAPGTNSNFDNDDLQFGDAVDTAGAATGGPVPDLDLVAGPSDTASGFADDRTVAVMPQVPEEPIAQNSSDPLATPPDQPLSSQAADPGLTVLADFDFSSSDEAPDLAPLDETILASDFSFDSTLNEGSDPASPMLGDDLFGDSLGTSGSASSSFDFGASASPPSLSPPAAVGEGQSASETEPQTAPITRLPLEPAPHSPPITRLPKDPEPALSASPPAPMAPEQDDVLEIEPLGESPPELQVELEPAASQPPALPSVDPAPPTSAPSVPAQPGAGDSTPELAPMIRERLHETLEKVAWEAFADISDTIVRQVIEKVESIAWEVIPQMTEMMIQEEIRRMKGEPE